MELGLTEILFIFVLALLLFGPKKLPEIGRQIGRGLAEFRRAKNEFQSQIEEEMRQLEAEDKKKAAPPPPPAPEGSVASGLLGQPHLPENATPEASAAPAAKVSDV